MKKLNKLLLATIVASTAFTSTAVLAAQSANVGITSDYVFRGISQSDEGAAVQAGLDWEHDNGFFAGTWASTVDFGDDANAEIDFYGGYFAEVNEQLSYDVSYTYYYYQGLESDDDYSYGEFTLNAYYDAFTFTYAFTPDWLQSDESASYIGAAYELELPQEYALTFNVGSSFGDYWDTYETSYIDFGATVAKTIGGFDLSAALTSTDYEDYDQAETRIAIAASKTFDF